MIKMQNRHDQALFVLKSYQNKEYQYIGEGFSGIVFHDNEFVYKVHIPLANSNYGEMDGLLYLNEKILSFKNSIHFYELELFKIKEIFILKYKYEKSEEIGKITEDELISFLTECWERKIICKSITKEKNFIRVNGKLKFIDYEILPYSDNLFLNNSARAFIYLKYPNLTEKEYNRLKRSIINNFNSQSLIGFDLFLNKVFFNITFKNSGFVYNETLFNQKNAVEIKEINENVFWKSIRNKEYPLETSIQMVNENYQFKYKISSSKINIRPIPYKVSLLIKTCPQDSSTIYQQVKHIVKQLTSPDEFYEKVISIDKKERNFLREFTSDGSLDKLYEEIQALIDEEIIDYYVELPSEEIENTNLKWFGIKTGETHTNSNIPVTPQLYAFEKMKGEYILQMDSDVMIGREDYEHSFLSDMIKALSNNENALSVGFNIPKNLDIKFTDYHAPIGGYKPEVRFSLLNKERLLKSLPWPNKLKNGKLEFAWYQSLNNYQKNTNFLSLRGGSRKSYFIHPQNYRKSGSYVWSTLLDRVEKNIIPRSQLEHFDLEGSFYDWTVPKRPEPMIVLVILEDQQDCFAIFRHLLSIFNQRFENYGIIIINNYPDLAYDRMLWNALKTNQNITYIHNKSRMTNSESTFLGIHYFITNFESIIVLLNPKDYLLGNNALFEILERMNMYNSDILIGKQYYSKNILDNGMISFDFTETRKYESNLYQNLKAFRKVLFEKISLYELKRKKNVPLRLNNFEKMNKKYEWYIDPEFVTLFTQLIEIADNPIRFDFYNLVIDNREINQNQLNESLEFLKSKPKNISFRNIKDGRVDFQPNMNKIEIDITYDCNLKCISCNRSCTQAASKSDYMSVNQIKEFIHESIDMNKKWELINILGGEPTLHPQFNEIVTFILKEYVEKFSLKTTIQITSNGLSKETKEKLSLLPKSDNIVLDKYSFKQSRTNIYFTPFSVAPIDLDEFKGADFKQGCWVTSYCGIGLNKYGFYPCGIAGSIDRVLGNDVGIKSLKALSNENLKDLLSEFCKLCGNFVDYNSNKGDFIPRCEKGNFTNDITTDFWVDAYLNFHKNKPQLSSIYTKEEENEK